MLGGVWGATELSGRVWIDETYFPVAAKDAVRRPDGKLPRGLSRNQMCIGVGIDNEGRVLAMFEGLGKPSKSRTWNAFGEHIEPGSALLHDMEGTHAVLVDRLGLEDESYDARLLRGCSHSNVKGPFE